MTVVLVQFTEEKQDSEEDGYDEEACRGCDNCFEGFIHREQKTARKRGVGTQKESRGLGEERVTGVKESVGEGKKEPP